MLYLFLSISAAFIWLVILLLPWQPWKVKETLESRGGKPPSPRKELTVLIPARNEEKTIDKTIGAVKKQGSCIRIIVVDDCSTDQTAAVAQKAMGTSGSVIRGRPLPPGWSGKVWALEQGFQRVNTPFVLLLDADIILKPGIITAAVEHLEKNHLDLVSLMAQLRMKNIYERLFMPAFIYFFKLLYPFQLSNRADTSTAAAAGGFILARTHALRQAGAFESIKDAIIDDCSLASKVKKAGFRTWIGLTRSVVSIRSYESIKDIWHMVERTAFAQLRYSWLLLILATVIMIILFFWPVLGLFSIDNEIAVLCIAALLFMCITYLPVIKFYHQPSLLALSLPAAAMLFMAMTWSSALSHLAGKGACWKGRCYRRETP